MLSGLLADEDELHSVLVVDDGVEHLIVEPFGGIGVEEDARTPVVEDLIPDLGVLGRRRAQPLAAG